jgi:hypothetical protein
VFHPFALRQRATECLRYLRGAVTQRSAPASSKADVAQAAADYTRAVTSVGIPAHKHATPVDVSSRRISQFGHLGGMESLGGEEE